MKISIAEMYSEPYYEYISAGHFGMTIPYNPNKSLPIEYINFSIHTLEKLLHKEMTKFGLLD